MSELTVGVKEMQEVNNIQINTTLNQKLREFKKELNNLLIPHHAKAEITSTQILYTLHIYEKKMFGRKLAQIMIQTFPTITVYERGIYLYEFLKNWGEKKKIFQRIEKDY